MNQILITHVCTELVVIGGLTFYFTRRHKESEKKIQDLEQRIQELERKTGKQNSAEKHIQTLYDMIEGLESRMSSNMPEPVRATPPMGNNIRNRKSKMRVVELPSDEDPVEEAIPISRPPPSGPSGISSMFPMDALFGMMSGQGMGVNPIEILMSSGMPSSSSIPTQQSPPSVEIEDEDDSDIKDELHSLGVETAN